MAKVDDEGSSLTEDKVLPEGASGVVNWSSACNKLCVVGVWHVDQTALRVRNFAGLSTAFDLLEWCLFDGRKLLHQSQWHE